MITVDPLILWICCPQWQYFLFSGGQCHNLLPSVSIHQLRPLRRPNKLCHDIDEFWLIHYWPVAPSIFVIYDKNAKKTSFCVSGLPTPPGICKIVLNHLPTNPCNLLSLVGINLVTFFSSNIYIADSQHKQAKVGTVWLAWSLHQPGGLLDHLKKRLLRDTLAI